MGREEQWPPRLREGHGQGDDPGMLRIDFDEKATLGELDWDTWFKWFDKNELALLMGDESRSTSW